MHPTHLLRAALAQPFPFRIAGRLPTRGDPRVFRGSALTIILTRRGGAHEE